MAKIFTYGSLMVPSIFLAVAGKDYRFEPARLSDYARYCVKGETYPGITLSPKNRVEGVVYFGVDDVSVGRLDAFEGEYYRRTAVSVTLHAGETVGAQAYVVRDEFEDLLSKEEWDFETFKIRHQKAFIERYFGFSRLS